MMVRVVKKLSFCGHCFYRKVSLSIIHREYNFGQNIIITKSINSGAIKNKAGIVPLN